MNEQLRILLVDYRNAAEFLLQCYEEGRASVETGALRDGINWSADATEALRNALIANPQWIADRQEFEE